MRLAVWSLIGTVATATAMLGIFAGALVGHYTVSGGLQTTGWQVPQGGREAQLAQLPNLAVPIRSAVQAEFPHDTPPPRLPADEARGLAASYYEPALDNQATFHPDAVDVQFDDRDEDHGAVGDPFEPY